MGGFLDELGKKLADRWLQLLVLPGAFYLAVAIAARTLGQSRPFDLHRLITQVIAWAKTPAATTVGGQVVLLAAALAGASCRWPGRPGARLADRAAHPRRGLEHLETPAAATRRKAGR